MYEAVNLLRTYNISDISIDLLYGLPFQTEETIKENITIATCLTPDRVSLFGYAHVPWMKSHMKMINEDALPNAKERLLQFDIANKALAQKGFTQIGLDHFVRPHDTMAEAFNEGRLKRNFQGYTTDNASALIGFGPSAISSLPEGYYQNTPNNHEYYASLDQGSINIAKGFTLSKDDKNRRSIIEHIMCYQAIDLKAFCTENDIDINSLGNFRQALIPLIKDGLVDIKDDVISIKTNASQVSRLVCAAFDTYIKPEAARHSQVA